MPSSVVTLDIARDTEDTSNADRGVVLEWRVVEGTPVGLGEVIAEVEVGKSSIEVVAPSTGTLLKILHLKDATVPIGDVLAVIGEPGADWERVLASHGRARHEGAAAPSAQGIRCRGECPECGARVAINGPISSALCFDCGIESPISQSVWQQVLDRVASGDEHSRVRVDPWSLVVRVTKGDPQCHNCGEELVIDDTRLDHGEDGTVTCSACGLGHAQLAPPSWIRERFPWVGSLLGVLTPATPRPSAEPPQCPSCGARQTLIADGAPVPRCSYCGMDVWTARPPTPLPRRWYLLR